MLTRHFDVGCNLDPGISGLDPQCKTYKDILVDMGIDVRITCMYIRVRPCLREFERYLSLFINPVKIPSCLGLE